MKNGMTLFGCGPKLALLSLPYILLSIAIMITYPEFLSFWSLNPLPFYIAGGLMVITGLIFWVYSAIFFIRKFKPGVLLTSGPFSLCRNPIYSSIILFIIPSIGLLLRSGLILTIPVVLYIGFRLTIHGETIILKRTFGEEYDNYERSVNEVFPVPPFLRKR
jgi:protein-S-isoprenylcysteine O-methyltransferase Ste14